MSEKPENDRADDTLNAMSERLNASEISLVAPNYDLPPQVSDGSAPFHTPHEYLMVAIGKYYYCIWGTVVRGSRFPDWEWHVDLETSYQEWADIGIAQRLYEALDIAIKDATNRKGRET